MLSQVPCSVPSAQGDGTRSDILFNCAINDRTPEGISVALAYHSVSIPGRIPKTTGFEGHRGLHTPKVHALPKPIGKTHDIYLFNLYII